MSDISKLISIVFDKSESIEGKNLLTNTYSTKSDIFKIGGKNTNWTWANFFILQDTVDINQCKITQGQFYIQERNDIWHLYDYKGKVLISGIEKIKEFVSETVNNETERIAKILGIEIPSTKKVNLSNESFQKIVYGAPGTGKSFGTDGKIHAIYKKGSTEEKEHVFRTTFHPDSDYSTFVGCYKPTKSNTKREQVILDYDSLVDKFKEFIDVKKNMTIACTTFGYEYHDSIVRMQPKHSVGELVADAYKNNTTYDSVVRGSMAVYEECTDAANISADITYDFVPQSFTKAYIKAWEEKLLAKKKDEEQKARLTPTENNKTKEIETKPIFLVIEEINRGNCAQIFGDLFQLLDREDDGMSCYPIKPDTDLGNYISGELRKFAQEHNIDIDASGYKEIINGEEMLLPDNLYIWATMNTCDQSLFPIDSAFKRRWDWEYVPISKGFDRENNVDIEYKIKIGNDTCDWWKFVQEINKKIGDTTKSEDKKLGFYFCKADNKIIDAKKFVGKVIFYLWNDVFKDYETDIFNIKSDDSNPTFEMFYKSDKGKTEIDDVKVKEFIEKVCPGIFSKVNSEEKQKEEE